MSGCVESPPLRGKLLVYRSLCAESPATFLGREKAVVVVTGTTVLQPWRPGEHIVMETNGIVTGFWSSAEHPKQNQRLGILWKISWTTKEIHQVHQEPPVSREAASVCWHCFASGQRWGVWSALARCQGGHQEPLAILGKYWVQSGHSGCLPIRHTQSDPNLLWTTGSLTGEKTKFNFSSSFDVLRFSRNMY